MNVLLAEGYADREYLSQYSDFGPDVEAHLATRTPAWAAPITGLSEDEIIAFARLFGSTKRAFVRLGYGFTRQRNGAAAMHAATCLPTMTGAWKYPGGGAAASAWRNFAFLREDLLESPGSTARILDMSRIGPVLCGDPRDLGDGPPIKAMLIQNTNPAVVAPDSLSVRKGLSRQDLFLAVHEQRMTETARYADIVFPATTMLEHDDFYISYGHTFLQAAKAVMKPVGEARSNHWLTSELAKRLGASQPMFGKPDWQVVDEVLKASGLAGADDLAAKRWIDCARPFEQMHFLEGFAHSDKRFHFKPDWAALGDEQGRMPRMPDYLDINDVLDEERNFRLVTAPSRHFLNTSFNNAASSRKAAERPTVLLHPENLDELGFAEGELIRIGNRQAETRVWVKRSDTVRRGVVVVEGVWPSEDFPGGVGINALTSAEPAWPAGGAVFHDTTVWLRKLGKEEQA
jgi:anaerobic selenocysteine-containing dehydrogenase